MKNRQILYSALIVIFTILVSWAAIALILYRDNRGEGRWFIRTFFEVPFEFFRQSLAYCRPRGSGLYLG